ncbi:MAG: hypothetical protein AB1611_06035 [bacterium]
MVKGKRGIVLAVFMIIISLSVVCVPLSNAQYTGTTLPPLSTAVGYGGFFNPYVFSPGLYRTAASYYPVFDPFASLLYAPFDPLLSASYYPALPTLPFAPLPAPAILPATTAVTPTRTAAQTGTWVGTWTSTWIAYIVLWHSGPMTLNIVVDPLLGTVYGTALLAGSRYTNIPFDVSGVRVNNIISLEGIPKLGFLIDVTCVLTSPTTMNGFYAVTAAGDLVDEGIFDLSLLAPVLI